MATQTPFQELLLEAFFDLNQNQKPPLVVDEPATPSTPLEKLTGQKGTICSLVFQLSFNLGHRGLSLEKNQPKLKKRKLLDDNDSEAGSPSKGLFDHF